MKNASIIKLAGMVICCTVFATACVTRDDTYYDVSHLIEGEELNGGDFFAVWRGPDSPLTFGDERLEIYLGGLDYTVDCPDVFEASDEVTLATVIYADVVDEWRYPICADLDQCPRTDFAQANLRVPELPFGLDAIDGFINIDYMDRDSIDATGHLVFENSSADIDLYNIPIVCEDN